MRRHIRSRWQSGRGGKLLVGCGASLVVLCLAAGMGGVRPVLQTVRSVQPTQSRARAPTNIPQPAAEGTPTAGAGAPAQPIPAFQSAGLGLTGTAWEATYGEGDRHAYLTHRRIYPYEGGHLEVDYYDPKGFFLEDSTDSTARQIIERIERAYDDDTGVALDKARAEAARFLPADAHLVQTNETGFGDSRTLVDVYRSPTLPSQFPLAQNSSNNLRQGGEPDNFIVMYHQNRAGRVSRWVVETGNSSIARPA
jgi:hypothetical protein